MSLYNLFASPNDKFSIDLSDADLFNVNIKNNKDRYKKIPLRNKSKNIVDYAIVDNEDYDNVIKHKWYISKPNKKSKYKTVRGSVHSIKINLSQFIIGKAPNNYVNNHINNNTFDNRKSNLNQITKAQNAQNRKKTNTKTTSKYIGVYYKNNKWYAHSCSIRLGSYDNENDAGIAYDNYVYNKFGKDASTNKLINFEDKTEYIPYIKREKKKNLPKYITDCNNNKFKVEIVYKKKNFQKYSKH